MDAITHKNIVEIGKLLRDKKISVQELVEQYKKEVQEKDKELHAFLELFDVDEDIARAEKMFVDGIAGPLTGIPVAVKDNILIKGQIASAGSKMLENYHATYDATVITKLKKAGVILFGRTNMDEFAMGGSTENSAFGPTKNPHDTSRVPGGSSGGSATAVAGGFSPVALGSDTGGSIREPASFCGIVGLKPTYGSVSRHGLMAMGSSFDVIGPLTHTVTDAEIVFNIIKGKDSLDATSHDNNNSGGKKTKVIGVPDFARQTEGLDPAVVENFNASIERLKKLGYTIKDISLPLLPHALAVYYILIPAEVSSNMARFDGIKYGFSKDSADMIDGYLKTRAEGLGPEVKRRIMLGTYVLSTGYYDAYYGKATAVRTLIREEFVNAFKEVDAIITPTAPSPAFKIGEKINDPLAMYLADMFTVPANIAGVPAMSVPSGTTTVEGKELPLGLQITTAHDDEETLFVIGKDFLGEK
jgi:aspartyl-tRNA(Asn)/glutamyl-tRNA(Gln) amidotransferase subunit A